MRKPNAIFLAAATLALCVSACTEDSGTGNPPFVYGDAASPVGAGEAGTMGTTAGTMGTTAGTIGTTAGTMGTTAGTMGMPGGMDAGTGPKPDGGPVAAADGGDAATEGGLTSTGDPDFDTCYAKVKPTCLAKEQNTAVLIQEPCKALTNLAVPLTDGTSYGPTTVQGGPYAGKIDWNQGMGTKFVSTTAQDDIAEQICLAGGIDTFAQPAAVTDELKNLRDLQWSLFTIFRPACMKKGEKYPVIAWANGTCGETHGYSALLTTIASYGFVVIAPNSTWTGTTTTAAGTPVQVSAIDYAEALNADMTSALYQRLDLTKVGAMGHSQGAAATGPTAADPRVKSVIFWNTGTSNDKPFLNVSADMDVGDGTVAALKSATEGASKPGAWIYYHKILATGGNSTGHLVLMEQPERVTDMAVAWWKWQLNGDQEAKKMFVGDSCGLCNMKDQYEYGKNSMLQ